MKKMMVEKGICVGCRFCEIVCSLSHCPKGEVNTKKARIHVYSEPRTGVDYPNVCRNCDNPPCARACPTGVINRNEQLGNMKLNEEACTACGKCVEACPFHGVQTDIDNGKPLFCDLCGGDPMCVKFCRALPHVGARTLNYMEPEAWREQHNAWLARPKIEE